jgi:DNA-binding NarL/FixJ family response regulator
MPDAPITLLIVDDLPAVRRGLRMRFELEPDLVVVGEAADGRECLALAEELSPDVVVLDLEMPVMDGLAAARELPHSSPASRAVILTLHDDRATRALAAAAGASGFVAKHEPPEMLISTIRDVGTHRSAAYS